MTSLLQEFNDDDEATCPSWLPCAPPVTARSARSNRALSLADAIARLPRDEQRVLGLVYVNALSLPDAAAVLGISEARACLLHAKASRQIRNELGL